MKLFYSFLVVLLSIGSVSSQAIKKTWPMINGDPAHTSNATINIAFPLVVANVFPYTFSGSKESVVSKDKIFFTESGNENKIHAVDLFTGDSLWTFNIPGTVGGIQFTPAVGHGVVLAGGQQGKGLYGLDANTGDSLWLSPIGTLYSRSPAIYDSLVYVAAVSGLKCIDLITGETRWSHDAITLQFSPAVDSSNVYFNSDGVIYAKDRLTGEERWSNTSVSNGHSTSYVLDDTLVYVGYRDTISALHLQTGNVLWQTSLDTNEVVYYSGMAALTDSYLMTKTIVDGSLLNHYRVIDKLTGNILSSYEKGWFTWSSPTVINDYLVDCSNNKILFMDIMTGDSIYQLSNLSFGLYPSQIIAANDKIIIIVQGQKITILQGMPSAVKNISADFSAAIVPNPARSNVDVVLDLSTASKVRLNIVTVSGALVVHDEVGYLSEGVHHLPVSVESLSSGLYFVQIQSENGVVTKKMYIEK